MTTVDAESIGRVRAFSLRSASGTNWRFLVGVLENPTEFPPGHLAEHQASSQPIRVYFRMDDGDAVVYRLEDASP